MSDVWGSYTARINQRGGSKAGSDKVKFTHNTNVYLPRNLSYTDVTIDGIAQDVAIINSDNLNEKTILSMPGEDIRHGGLVHWMDNYWLVTERDANTTLYTRAKLEQCNYFLKWVSEDGVIHEQWCIVEDGTKYLTGEMEDRIMRSAYAGMRMNKYLLNCWDALRVVLPQRNHEKRICVMV